MTSLLSSSLLWFRTCSPSPSFCNRAWFLRTVVRLWQVSELLTKASRSWHLGLFTRNNVNMKTVAFLQRGWYAANPPSESEWSHSWRYTYRALTSRPTEIYIYCGDRPKMKKCIKQKVPSVGRPNSTRDQISKVIPRDQLTMTSVTTNRTDAI